MRLHVGPIAAELNVVRHAEAFTYGTHIVLGHRAQTAADAAREAILAHELIHVLQQSTAPVSAVGVSQASATEGRSRLPLPRAPPVRPAQRVAIGDQHLAVPAFVEDAAGAIGDLGSAAVERTAGLAGDVADVAVEIGGVVLESAREAVEYLAPGLLDLLEGGLFDDLTELFCTGVGGLVGTLLAPLRHIDPLAALERASSGLAALVEGVRAQLGEAASAALGLLLRPLQLVVNHFGDDIVGGVRALSEGVGSSFTTLWEQVAVPVLDFLADVGGAVWSTFTGVVGFIWDLTAPIRRLAEWAWDWLMEQFDLAWESTSGVRSWLDDLAEDVWTDFLALIEPVSEPLMVVGGVLLLLSPLGPIVVLTQVLPPIWDTLTWLVANWRDVSVVVWARETLERDVLPAIIGAVNLVKAVIAGATSWLAGIVAAVARGVRVVLESFTSNPCLRVVGDVLDHVADQFDRLGAWAMGGFAGLEQAIGAVFDALRRIFEPILDFLGRLTIVAANPPLLPVAITGAVWLLLPDEFKSTVVNFVLDLLLAVLAGATAFLVALGPLAPVLASAASGFLAHLRSGENVDDRVRIDASDKIANLMAGGGPAFVAGFAFGLVHGLIDGIIDPFRLLFMLFELVVTALRVLGRVLAPYVQQLAPQPVAAGIAGLQEALRVPGEGVAVATSEVGAGPEPETRGGTARGPPAAAIGPAVEPVAGQGTGPGIGADVSVGAPVAAGGAASVGGALPADGALVSDEEVARRLSPGVISEVAGTAPPEGVDAAALETEMRAEVADTSNSVSSFADLLGDAWDWMLRGAAQLGARLAEALLGWLRQRDFDLGHDLGWLAGMVLFELLLAYFTAGGYTVLKQGASVGARLLSYLLRFLDLGGEILGVLGRMLQPLKRPLLAGLGAAKDFLSRFGFVRGLLRRIEDFARSVFRFGDEAAAPAPRLSGPGEVPAAVPTPVRRPPEAARGPEMPPGRRATAGTADEAAGRAAREVLSAPPARSAQEAVEEGADGALRVLDEPGVPRVADDAAKAAQFAEARVAARIVAETNDAIDTPIRVALVQLIVLKRRYRWIDTFRADPRGPGRHTIYMVASDTPIDDYDEEPTDVPLTAEDLKALLPGVHRMSSVRQRALDLLNSMPPETRRELLDALQRRPPDEAAELLSEMGRVDPDLFRRSTARRGEAPDVAPPEAGGARRQDVEFGSVEEAGLEDLAMPHGEAPAMRSQPERFLRGNFAHQHAELLIPERQFRATTWEGGVAVGRGMPSGLAPEVTVRRPNTPDIRIDRVDWDNGIIYEIRPDNPDWVDDMVAAMPGRTRAMDEVFPGPWPWRGRIVTYSADEALGVLVRQMGHSPDEARAILRVYGFRFP